MCGGDKPKEQKQSWGEREQAAVAADKWNYYVQRLAPYSKKLVDESAMTETDYQTAGRRALVDSEAGFSDSPEVVAGGQRGGDLGVQIARRSTAKTATRGSNLVRSGMQTDDRHAAGVEAIIAAGNGERGAQQRTQSYYSSLNFNQASNQARQDAQKWQDDARFKGQVIGTVGALGYGAMSRMPPPAHTGVGATGGNYAIPNTSNLVPRG